MIRMHFVTLTDPHLHLQLKLGSADRRLQVLRQISSSTQPLQCYRHNARGALTRGTRNSIYPYNRKLNPTHKRTDRQKLKHECISCAGKWAVRNVLKIRIVNEIWRRLQLRTLRRTCVVYRLAAGSADRVSWESWRLPLWATEKREMYRA